MNRRGHPRPHCCHLVLQMLVLLTVPLDIDGMGVRSSSTGEDKLNDILTKLVQIDTLSQWVSKLDLHLNSISSSVGLWAPSRSNSQRLINISVPSQPVSLLWKGETDRLPVCLCLWQVLSTTTGSFDPGPVDGNRNTGRKVQTHPWSTPSDDENMRSAVLLRFRAGVAAWLSHAVTMPQTAYQLKNARAAASRLESFSLLKPHANSLWRRTKKMACSVQLTLFCRTTTVQIGGRS